MQNINYNANDLLKGTGSGTYLTSFLFLHEYSFFNLTSHKKEDFCKKNSLYLYNNIYYLVLENIDITQTNFKKFNSYISEFSTYKSYSKNFKYKLKEHGKLIINKNAINKIFNIFT